MNAVASASRVAGHIAEGLLEVDIPLGGTDEPGQLLHSMASMRENIQAMVERERAERRSARRRLVDALEGSREGVVLVDADGAMLLANSQARAFLPALKPVFIPGVSYDALLDSAREQGHLQSVNAAGLTADAEEAQLSDGRWLRLARSTISEGGFVAIWSDITVLKEREAVLRAALALTVAAIPDLPAIRADSVKLQQIPLNLLSNTIKFMPPDRRRVYAMKMRARISAGVTPLARSD